MRTLFLIFSITIGLLIQCTYRQIEDGSDCPGEEILAIVDKQDANCGIASGVIHVQISTSDEIQLTLFRINQGVWQESGLFDGLTAGSYKIEAQLSEGCTVQRDVELVNLEGLNVTTQIIPSDCDQPTGSIQIFTTGQQGRLNLTLNGQRLTNADQLNQLGVGTYSLSIIDESGCVVIQEVVIPSSVTSNSILAITKQSCALSGCHSGNVKPDLMTVEQIDQQADRIKVRTSNKSMPPPSTNLKLSDEELSMIECWVSQ